MSKAFLIESLKTLKENVRVYCIDRLCEGEEEINSALDDVLEMMKEYL